MSEPDQTRAVHADRGTSRDGGPVVPPIHQSATFHSADERAFAAAAVEPRGQDFYTRYGNPDHAHVAAVLAELENAETALVTASGMGALTTTVLSLVSAGDHVIGQTSTYGGTASLLTNLLPRLGIHTTQVDQTDPQEFARAMTPRTKLVLLETPSNPLLRITDLRAVTELARAHDARTVVDSTFATPVNQRPLELGADLVLHSATKYLNGHSDVSAGAVAGPAELLDRVWETGVVTGATLGPFDAWLLLRGLRTLPLRMERHNANGQALAEALRTHPGVTAVHYPGLESHPQHALAAEQMSGYGGVLAVEFTGGYTAASTFIERLRYPRRAASLGGVESLAVHPGAMWAGVLDEQQLADAGIPPGLVRLAAGIEESSDLVSDVLAAAEGL
ncbi:trans-sulfuration enzyme family protein [Actinopolyspora saharensis]|uniref:homocysteine desulfhydrase n=1 Tax=Actinopolyspora saharensis TaxID=995062 RepID=A0A1H1F316_9ACTN|nr:aminotransferase class I/II-fold pyridoxal phosphate-dependent enzyme [Actinopolyspora saharensis]SDQ94806.1 methionine-gamma-lyase [Actinopolyspora saharensis]